MDVVLKFFAVGMILVVTAACSPRSSNSVFNENSQSDEAECVGEAIQNRFIVKWANGTITVESGVDKEKFLKDFVEPKLNDIQQVEYDRKLRLFLPAETDPPSAEVPSSDFWGQSMIEADVVWSKGVLGEGAIVAVVDSGADVTHPQLQNQISINTNEIPANGVDDDNNGAVDDVYGYDFAFEKPIPIDTSGHGTHVSGIILADHSMGYMKGVAPKAKLVPAKFIGKNGGSLGDAIRAVQYGASRGAKIINASWGGPDCSNTLRETIRGLGEKNILFVAAAGNDGKNIDRYPDYPASYNLPNQVTVGASSIYDLTTSFSNIGAFLVHLVAPGDEILSLTPEGMEMMSGTSMAAPFVSGAAALLWGAHPNATVAQIRTALFTSVDGGSFPVATRGRLNVRKALEQLDALDPK